MTRQAVVRDRGRQYAVKEGDLLTVDRLEGNVGSDLRFEEVLCLEGDRSVEIGQPLVSGASVSCEIVEHTRGPKVVAFKIRRRKNYRRKKGHRQDLTVVRIKSIQAGS